MTLPIHWREAKAFTLIEVVLAIAIATGLLLVALSFHHQATELRRQVLQESDRISALRLVMERMSADLRCARGDEWQGFSGASNSIQFVKIDFPMPPPSPPMGTNAPSIKVTDLQVITYELLMSLQETNTTPLGLSRKEEPLNRISVTVTNSTESMPTNVVTDLVKAPEPITDVVRRLQFRFWDGHGWLEAWSDTVPPIGVEITLSAEAEETEEFQPEVFRRVVFIAAGVKSERIEIQTVPEWVGP